MTTPRLIFRIFAMNFLHIQGLSAFVNHLHISKDNVVILGIQDILEKFYLKSTRSPHLQGTNQ